MITRLHRMTLAWGALLALLVFPAPGRAYAAQGFSYSVLGFEAATGKYGTDTRTASVHAPVTAAISSERFGVSLEIPFVYQSSSAVNTRLF